MAAYLSNWDNIDKTVFEIFFVAQQYLKWNRQI